MILKLDWDLGTVCIPLRRLGSIGSTTSLHRCGVGSACPDFIVLRVYWLVDF